MYRLYLEHCLQCIVCFVYKWKAGTLTVQALIYLGATFVGKFCCANNHGSLCSVCKSDINSIAVSRIWGETNDSGHCRIALSQLFSISNTKLSSLKSKREGGGRGEGSPQLKSTQSCVHAQKTMKWGLLLNRQNQKGPTPLTQLGLTLKFWISFFCHI